MDTTDVPDVVQRLLREHIESYEQLEILLLLRAKAPQAWTEERVGDQLGLSITLVSDAVASLIAQGLVRRQHGGRELVYAPHPQILDEAVKALALSYASQRLEIVKLMSANAIKRMRTDALRAFADAFVLRKDKG